MLLRILNKINIEHAKIFFGLSLLILFGSTINERSLILKP